MTRKLLEERAAETAQEGRFGPAESYRTLPLKVRRRCC